MKSLRNLSLLLAASLVLPALIWAQGAETPLPEAPKAPDAPAMAAEAAQPVQTGTEADAAKVTSPVAEKAPAVSEPEKPAEKVWVRRSEMVGIGQDVHVKANERVSEVVVIFGNLIMDGKVDGEVVVIGGKAKINGPVGGELVLVLSDGELGPDAQIGGDAVVVGGRLGNSHGVKIGGSSISIEQHFPQFGAGLDWFRQGLILGRPMVPSMNMTWIIAGAFLGFYLFIALVFGRAVNATASSLENRPGGTLIAALLFLPAFPLFILVLTVTGIGILLVPFVMIGLFFAAIFGKVAFLAFVGRAVLRPAGPSVAGVAVLSTLLGGIIITLLYGIWYLGFALWALTTWIGIGMVISTILASIQRERPKSPPKAAVAPAPATGSSQPSPAAAAAPAMQLSAPASSGLAGDAPQGAPAPEGAAGFAAGATTPPVSEPPPPTSPPPLPQPFPAALSPTSAVGYERASFGIRLAAILIDLILICAIVGSLGGGKAVALFMGLYCALMWFYRATTIGGIICNLKIVRLDGRPMDGPTAVVRTLGAFVSMICVGIGFLWVIWDPEKQTWHDKIAGTTVIRVPKGMSLV